MTKTPSSSSSSFSCLDLFLLLLQLRDFGLQRLVDPLLGEELLLEISLHSLHLLADELDFALKVVDGFFARLLHEITGADVDQKAIGIF